MAETTAPAGGAIFDFDQDFNLRARHDGTGVPSFLQVEPAEVEAGAASLLELVHPDNRAALLAAFVDVEVSGQARSLVVRLGPEADTPMLVELAPHGDAYQVRLEPTASEPSGTRSRLIDRLPTPVLVVAYTGQIMWSNDRAMETFGAPVTVGRNVADWLERAARGTGDEVGRSIEAAAVGHAAPGIAELEIGSRSFDVQARNLDDGSAVVVFIDVTQRSATGRRARDYAELTSDLVATVDEVGNVLHIETRRESLRWLAGITRLDDETLAGPSSTAAFDSLLATAPPLPGSVSRQLGLRDAAGAVHRLSVRAARAAEGVRLVATDVTELDRTRRRLQTMAERDSLTGLSNRRDLMRRAPERIATGGATVLCLDIDRFKALNDTWGHPAGDAVLRELGVRLRSVCRNEDLLGRLGGDEFVVVAEAGDASDLADRIQQATSGIYDANGNSAVVTTSVGAAHVPADVSFPAGLARADDALYEAKRTGRGRAVTAPEPATAAQRPRATVLVVEDETDLQAVIDAALHDITGTIGVAASVAEALDHWTELAPDLVVLDLRLADGSGLEVAEEILAQRPDLPIVVFSAYVDPDTTERALALGVRRVIEKTQLGGLVRTVDDLLHDLPPPVDV